MGYKERQIGAEARLHTSRRKLGALAGAAVVVSVLGAKLGASMGEATGASCCATEALSMKTRKRIVFQLKRK